MLKIISTEYNHLHELAENMRQMDKDEVVAMGFSPLGMLVTSFENAVYCKTGLYNDKVACIFGAAGTMLGDVGIPFLLTSDLVYQFPIQFVKSYKNECKKMLELFLKLENFVKHDYTQAIKLLELTGFTIGEPELYCGAPMRRFTKIRG